MESNERFRKHIHWVSVNMEGVPELEQILLEQVDDALREFVSVSLSPLNSGLKGFPFQISGLL